MNVLFINIASIDDPENVKQICIHRSINLKTLMDKISATLQSEVYGLYLNNKKLTDVEAIDNNTVLYGATCISPYEHVNQDYDYNYQYNNNADSSYAKQDTNINVAVIGEKFSGKTSFIMKYVHNLFVEKHTSTCIAAEYFHIMQNEGVEYTVSIVDTTNSFIEDYDHSWLSDRQVFIITISVEQLSKWHTIMLKYIAVIKGYNASMIFVMVTKVDLLNFYTSDDKKNTRAFIKELKLFCRKQNIVLFRSSAKANKRIDAPFLFFLKRLQSVNLTNFSRSTQVSDVFYKKPQLFCLLEKVMGIVKNNICGL